MSQLGSLMSKRIVFVACDGCIYRSRFECVWSIRLASGDSQGRARQAVDAASTPFVSREVDGTVRPQHSDSRIESGRKEEVKIRHST